MCASFAFFLYDLLSLFYSGCFEAALQLSVIVFVGACCYHTEMKERLEFFHQIVWYLHNDTFRVYTHLYCLESRCLFACILLQFIE